MDDTVLFEQDVLLFNMKRLKEERHLTYEQIGNATNLDKSAVYKLFKKINTPTITFLAQFSRFLEIPLYYLFIPNEEMLRTYYLNIMLTRLKEFDLTIDELAMRLNLHPLRVKEIFDGKTSPSKEELFAIFDLLGLNREKVYTFENKMLLLKNLLTDFGLNDDQKENIVEYILMTKK